MNNTQPLVTVGITTYNNESTIETCIESILDQTFQDFEVLIINDGSNDDTSDILNTYATHPKINIINDSENLGSPTRHNELAELANGKYLAKVDADDYMAKTRLEVQLRYFAKSKLLKIISSWAYSINEAGRVIGTKNYKSNISPFNLLFKNPIIHSTVMAETKWFLENKYDPTLLRCQDVDLWVRSIKSENYLLIEDYLVYYRESIDKAKLRKSREYTFKVINKNKSRLNFLEYSFLNFLYFTKYMVS